MGWAPGQNSCTPKVEIVCSNSNTKNIYHGCYVDAGAVQFKCNLGHNLIESKLQLAFVCK
jgi:hypothetical protein